MAYATTYIAVDIGTENSKAALDLKVLEDKTKPIKDGHTERFAPLLIPSYNAYNREGRLEFIGERAKEAYGRSTDKSRIQVRRFMSEGEIDNTEMAEDFLKMLVRKYLFGRSDIGAKAKKMVAGTKSIIAVPPRAKGPQRAAFKRCLRDVTRGEVTVVSQTIAALASNTSLENSIATMVVEIGGGSSDVEAISQNSTVARRTVKTAGDKITDSIKEHLLLKFGIRVDFMGAEEVKLAVATALPSAKLHEFNPSLVPQPFEVKGIDPTSNTGKRAIITCDDIFPAVDQELRVIEAGIRESLNEMPDRVRRDLMDREAVLAGGSALLRGLDLRLKQTFNFPFVVASNAATAVIEGLVFLQDNPDLLELVKEFELN